MSVRNLSFESSSLRQVNNMWKENNLTFPFLLHQLFLSLFWPEFSLSLSLFFISFILPHIFSRYLIIKTLSPRPVHLTQFPSSLTSFLVSLPSLHNLIFSSSFHAISWIHRLIPSLSSFLSRWPIIINLKTWVRLSLSLSFYWIGK